jgi:hypothetical protein
MRPLVLPRAIPFALVPAFLFALLAFSQSSRPAQAARSPRAQEDTTTVEAKSDSAEADTTGAEEEKKEEEEEKGTAFEEVVEDCEKIEGLFTLYHKKEDGSVFMEILPDQLDKLYLCSITREAGDGTYLDSGAMVGNFPFELRKVGKRIQFLHKNVYFQAQDDPEFARAIERGVSSSVMASGEVEGLPHPERKSVLIKLSDFFLQDMHGIAQALSEYYKASYSFDKENSFFSSLKSFPLNSEIEVTLHFSSSKPHPSATLPDSRSFFTRYHYSLSGLPQTGYVPRVADDRVGYFSTMFQDYSDLTRDTPYRRYISRWHLEKKNPGSRSSEPVEPVVFWLENTIPMEYREAIKRGVLFWNDAFEKIGFKNAIVVKQMPDDAEWDPADIRYNTVRWILVPGAAYAVGPSLTNPLTGEIYAADIRLCADMVRVIYQELEEFVDPVARGPLGMPSDPFAPPGDPTSLRLCRYATGAVGQASFGRSLLEARLGPRAFSRKGKKYMDDFLINVVAHEVGHTLGLRHNFKASSVHDLEALSNERLTLAEGLTGSIMEYAPVSVAGKDRKQGQYWQTTPGTYDVWAIEYGYKPVEGAEDPVDEIDGLEKIASRGSDPELAYGTDEDALGFSPRGVDPTANVWDLGSDPLAWYEERVGLVKELWNGMEETFEKEGTRYPKLRHVFAQGVVEYFLAGLNASKYIGGLYQHRDHVGDPEARIPFEPVPSERQRRALNFLCERYFAADAFHFSPSLINKLAPERFWDFTGSIWSMPRLDYPAHDVVLAIQAAPLHRMYDPVTLSRLVDLELHYASDEDPFTMAEMFREVREAVWSELDARENVGSFRRNLQRQHLSMLVTLLVAPPPATPEDASTLARADLLAIRRGVRGALSSQDLDPMTRAHLEESGARIEAALQAGLNRGG